MPLIHLEAPRNCVRTPKLAHRPGFHQTSAIKRILFVGAESADEFANAMRLARHGHKVVVANPYPSSAARRFAGAGGVFMQTSIEWLAPSAHFDLICENYPFTLRQIEGVCEINPC